MDTALPEGYYIPSTDFPIPIKWRWLK